MKRQENANEIWQGNDLPRQNTVAFLNGKFQQLRCFSVSSCTTGHIFIQSFHKSHDISLLCNLSREESSVKMRFFLSVGLLNIQNNRIFLMSGSELRFLTDLIAEA